MGNAGGGGLSVRLSQLSYGTIQHFFASKIRVLKHASWQDHLPSLNKLYGTVRVLMCGRVYFPVVWCSASTGKVRCRTVLVRGYRRIICSSNGICQYCTVSTSTKSVQCHEYHEYHEYHEHLPGLNSTVSAATSGNTEVQYDSLQSCSLQYAKYTYYVLYVRGTAR